jgi:hypothetical protein
LRPVLLYNPSDKSGSDALAPGIGLAIRF